MAAICGIFGNLLNFLYELFGQNYGLALIGFTLIVNIVLLPLTLKQQRSTAMMQAIQPELVRLQNKYKNDKEKLNTEMMKLYQNNNVNPMGGCLPLLIQLPIIFLLYQVIIKPLTYMRGLTADQIATLRELVGAGKNVMEVDLASKAAALGDKMPDFFTPINFDFFGLDLGAAPNLSKPSLLWIIPILAGVTTYALSWLTMRQSEAKKTEEQKRKEKDNPSMSQMQTMNKIMPLFTVWIAFSFAAGIGFYWIMNNLFKMIQQIVVNKLLEKGDPLVIETSTSNKNKKKK